MPISNMLKVVSNSSPIIHLNKMGFTPILERLYKKIHITDYVYEECTADFSQSTDRREEVDRIRQAPFIEINEIKNNALFLAFSKLVDIGEASALVLALEKKSDLILLGDLEARELADVYGLTYTGTIGVLLRAREVGLIDQSIPDILNELKNTGFYISKKVERYILGKV
jgi:uncharacterized protein